MIQAIEFMFLPFLACMLLIAINVYFGIHIIKRDIIFINIAFGQIAALGGTIAVIMHFSHEGEGTVAYFFSLGFTLLAAAIFTLLKDEQFNVSLEALVGISYALAATGAVVLLDKMAGGDVHVHEMLVGSILWVSWEQILKLFIVFTIVGSFHYFFRNKFIKISDTYIKSDKTHSISRWWDFLFYASFGIVVVHSVQIGGILTVFAFLIIPASISILFAENWLSRIVIGWCIGTIVSVCGLYISWIVDVPSGPTVILFLGVFLFFTIIVKAVKLL